LLNNRKKQFPHLARQAATIVIRVYWVCRGGAGSGCG
jgi:hypothetical protein